MPTPMPPYVPESLDRRSYMVRGATLHVVRGADERSVGFNGAGRDGDYVPDGAPEPEVLNALTAGVDGLSPSSSTDYSVASEDALVIIETRMVEASGGPWAITRGADESMEVAQAMLDTPVMDGMTRTWSLRGAWSLSIAELPSGDAAATPWAWGKDPGDWLATTLAAMQVAETLISGAGNAAVRAVPRERVRELVERALAEPLLGVAEFQMTDARARR